MAGTIDYDAIIVAVAAPRGGVCARSDLLSAGLSPGAINRRIRVGLLEPAGRGVYIVAGLTNRLTLLHRAVTAVPASVVSHTTAAQLHGFAVEPVHEEAPVHITVPNHTNRRLTGILLHRHRCPPGNDDIIYLDGLPVTSPARTIVDLAAVVGPSRLRYIVQSQLRDDNPTKPELVACFDAVANHGVNGVAQLRRLLRNLLDEEPVSHSALETAVAQLLEAHSIFGFRPQFKPPWYDGLRGIVDFAHPLLRIVLEADGRRWHRRDQDMADDRRRDRLATRHGWLTVRVTWAEVTQRPAAVATDVRAIVATRVAAGRTAS